MARFCTVDCHTYMNGTHSERCDRAWDRVLAAPPVPPDFLTAAVGRIDLTKLSDFNRDIGATGVGEPKPAEEMTPNYLHGSPKRLLYPERRNRADYIRAQLEARKPKPLAFGHDLDDDHERGPTR